MMQNILHIGWSQGTLNRIVKKYIKINIISLQKENI